MTTRIFRTPEPFEEARRRSARRPGGSGLSGALAPGQIEALQQTAGNRAVVSLLKRTPAPVQRWAWVSGAQVNPSDQGLTTEMKAFASDKVVRDYGSDSEFKHHAAGATDYLGNLPGPASRGTWVRFSPNGTNLLGERHTEVTLEQVVRAVGTTSFIYEPFSVDAMAPGSAMKAAYETENQARFASMGIGSVADKQPFGAESLFPKIGYGMNLILPFLRAGDLDALKPAAYRGQPGQRYVKIAWAYAKDVAGEVAALKAQNKQPPAELTKLKKVRKQVDADLDTFITGLPVDGFLGDALDSLAGKKVIQPLITFCEAVLDAMLARASTDATLSQTERDDLNKMKKGSETEKSALFSKWRNLHFLHAVRGAAARGVRYAGMGREHLKYLIGEGLPPNSHPYDMHGKELADFELLTKNLATSAKP